MAPQNYNDIVLMHCHNNNNKFDNIVREEFIVSSNFQSYKKKIKWSIALNIFVLLLIP